MTTTNANSTAQGTVEHIDPNQIVVEANVRTDAKLPTEFLASIKQNGVLTPILARRDEHGNVIVRAGQRRTLAAREVGLVSIPAYIVDADEKTVDRIIQQMAENEHREAVTDADRVAAYQQLAFEGLTPTVIAKRLNTKPATVKAGIAVAENAAAASAIVSHSLTLDQAATLIEFQGDDDTVADLIETATTDPGQFAHAAQRARDEKARAEEKAAVEAEYAARGYTVLDRERGHYETDYTLVRNLVSADGESLTQEQVDAAEGRAVYVGTYFGGQVRAMFYIADPKGAGFRKSSGHGATTGPMTDEQKAERKTLIANNKAWASAAVVRREWLASFLSRKTLPKDAAQFIAQGLTVHGLTVGSASRDGNALAHELMGVERGGYYERDKLAGIVAKTPSKAQHVTLAVVLGGIESNTSKTTWRSPASRDGHYFTQLEAWGYTLSDVEKIVTAEAHADAPTEAPGAEQDDSGNEADQSEE
ncbi:ParB/RepB/Spo0J family partition protein [Herbiconiux ginsengi]|uniref:Chromosome partitioning protein, ParB family n=1 Tax=Herbiconiux ginsengi TaxID=381665 RepID=A0A1H3TDU6_9MICO|nr:ParB N-terminal domain-containing protein [Herbiconiux ginsengi]SDZ48473.1 chromosome partitioning protein, ParB family [Herbiconiux ginsengi]